MTTEEKLRSIVKALDSKKGEDIKVIKITDLTIIADYFVIAGGTSSTHTKSLSQEVDYKLGLLGVNPTRSEGSGADGWVVLDYSDIVVHIFYKAEREFYQLERLWADGEEIDVSQFIDKE
ncbi:MAG: ribosome silencing factor [Oscillospiraceae bacterium]|nr:ribosome silencing factor [Oscillospiraceae bacterium]